MKKLIIIGMLLLIAQITIGQTSSFYNFNLIPNGTYTPLVNKTVFQSGSQLNTDDVSGPITLPIAFSLYGKPETVAYITNNGIISFGAPVPKSTIYDGISSTLCSQYDNSINFSNQWVAAQTGNPEISYGQNASGDFVVQYQDVGIQGSLTARFTFQIILKANGTTWQIVFGPNCTGGEVNSRTSQIGSRGKQTPRPGATPITTVFNNLTMGSGDYNTFQPNNNFSGGIAIGKTNSSTVATRKITVTTPNSGLIYQWIKN